MPIAGIKNATAGGGAVKFPPPRSWRFDETAKGKGPSGGRCEFESREGENMVIDLGACDPQVGLMELGHRFNRSTSFGILTALFIGGFSMSPAVAEFDQVEFRKKTKLFKKRHRKNNSAAELIEIQRDIGGYLLKVGRKQTGKCRKRYANKFKKTKRKIRAIQARQNLYSFRGRWNVDEIDPTLTNPPNSFVYHFRIHNTSTDFVVFDVENLDTGVVLRTVSGYQKFETLNGVQDNGLAIRYSLTVKGTKTASPLRMSGQMRFQNATVLINGERFASPFN